MYYAPGINPDLTMLDYHRAPAVNARLLHTIVDRCPAAAFHESWLNPHRAPEETSKVMDAGAIAHAIVLEGSLKRVAVIDPVQYPAKTTGAIPEGWTNQAIRQARDDAYAAGKIPILKSAFIEIEGMAAAALEFVATLVKDEPAIFKAFQQGGGQSEVSMFWEDAGTPCRIRPDRINTERTLIVDYKTGDGIAEPNAWGRSSMIRMGYYTAAAFYRRGVRALCGTNCAYVFLVQESRAPYLCSLVGVDDAAFALGGAKITYGLDLWRKCEHANHWPAYPSRVCYPVIPQWEAARWEEFEALGVPYEPTAHGGDKPKVYAREDEPLY